MPEYQVSVDVEVLDNSSLGVVNDWRAERNLPCLTWGQLDPSDTALAWPTTELRNQVLQDWWASQTMDKVVHFLLREPVRHVFCLALVRALCACGRLALMTLRYPEQKVLDACLQVVVGWSCGALSEAMLRNDDISVQTIYNEAQREFRHDSNGNVVLARLYTAESFVDIFKFVNDIILIDKGAHVPTWRLASVAMRVLDCLRAAILRHTLVVGNIHKDVVGYDEKWLLVNADIKRQLSDAMRAEVPLPFLLKSFGGPA